MTMFHEWMAAGAAFGISAFFAVLVFLLCSGAVLGLLGLLAGFFFSTEDKGE